MRVSIVTLAMLCGLTMLAASAEAGAIAPGGAPGDPAMTLVAGGCGPGFHPHTWQGPYGHWHTACEPNGAGVARACAPGSHWREWRGPYGRLHAECVPNG